MSDAKTMIAVIDTAFRQLEYDQRQQRKKELEESDDYVEDYVPWNFKGYSEQDRLWDYYRARQMWF